MSDALIQKGAVVRYPYSYAQMVQDDPGTSYPRDPSDEVKARFGIHPVASTPRPTVDLTKNAVEGEPALVDGAWVQTWLEVDASAEQRAARQELAKYEADKAAVKEDGFVTAFVEMTPDEVATYITGNGTTLAALRTIVIKLAIIVLILARHELRR